MSYFIAKWLLLIVVHKLKYKPTYNAHSLNLVFHEINVIMARFN